MKRIISIAFLSAALLVLTALSLVSHHHHRAAMCTVMELCEADQTYNDQHTAHDTAGEQNGKEGCVIHTTFAPASVQSSVASPDAQSLQAVGQAVLSAVPAPMSILRQTKYGLFIIAYISAAPHSGSGLRAPPSLS